MNVVSVEGSHVATSRLLTYFSSWSKLKVAVARLLKWKTILLEKSRRRREEKAAVTGKQSTDNNVIKDITEETRVQGQAWRANFVHR